MLFMNTLLQEELYEYLYKVIETLPFRTKKIIKLTLNGYSNKEIAEALNISINTVKTLKKSGYKKLKESSLRHIYLPLFTFGIEVI